MQWPRFFPPSWISRNGPHHRDNIFFSDRSVNECSEGDECVNVSEEYDYFMRTDMTPYIGEYVAICGRKIVAHSKDFKEAYSEARKVCGDKRPFIAAVPEPGIRL